MKKALLVLAVAAAAVVSQAATVSWKSGDLYLPANSTGAKSTTLAGSGVVAAYYFVVDSAAYTAFDAETAFNDRFDVNESTGAITLKSGVTASYNRTSTGGGAANWTNQTINEGQSIYVIAIYTYTDASSKTGFYIANNAYAVLNTGSLSADGRYTDLASSVSSWTPAAVPEPTTLALLALGLAAVGLKRKVA